MNYKMSVWGWSGSLVEPQFSSQYPHGSSQPALTPFLGVLRFWPPLGITLA